MDEHIHHQTPMSLFHCIGYEMALSLIVASSMTVVLYVIISAIVFMPAAKNARSLPERLAWVMLALIFPICGGAGYGTTILAGWYPEPAYILKLTFVIFDNMACVGLIITRILGVDFSGFRHEFREKLEMVLEATHDDAEKLKRVQQLIDEDKQTKSFFGG